LTAGVTLGQIRDMPVFRTTASLTGETELPGNTKPPGFSGQGERAGGAITLDWWVAFIDAGGNVLAGGSATVQWYGVSVDGSSYSTPTIGDPVVVDANTIKSRAIPETVWPWCRVTAMTDPPVGAAKLRVYTAQSAAVELDTAGLATPDDLADLATSAEVGAVGDAVAAVGVDVAALPNAAAIATAVGAQAACEAGIVARVAAGTIPDPAAVETRCGAAITTAALATAAQVAGLNNLSSAGAQSACTAALTAANLATAPNLAALQTTCNGLATASALTTLQNTVNGLNNLSSAGAQTACGAAITAANLATAAQVSALNNLSSGGAQTACESAIDAKITDIANACANAVDGLNVAGSVPGQVVTAAYGSGYTHTQVTAGAGSTSGTLVTNPGGGVRIYVVAIIIACTTAQSSFTIGGSGASAMATWQIPQNDTLEVNRLFDWISRSGSGSNLTWNKTSGANLSIDIWYYTGA
jgi:hypothetical protein